MTKKLIATSLLVAALQVSCTDSFDALNTDPNRVAANAFDPNLLLPSAEYNYVNGASGYNGPILFQAGWVQILASTSSGGANYYTNADKYVISGNTADYQQRSWNIEYQAATYAYEMQKLTAGNAARSNLNNIGAIMQIQALAYITDVYGDIPYTQALQAKTNSITAPAYDTQQSIYTSMLTQLDKATAALSTSGDVPTNDAMAYKGDITKWKKYGYSLMLKLAMRLVKVDATTAKTYAEKAAAAGVFTSSDDDAYVVADNANGYGNSNGQALTTLDDIYQVRWSKPLIDYLQGNSDPRLSIVAEVPPSGLIANKSATSGGNTTASAQMGLPSGYDLNGGATDISKAPNYPGATGSGSDVTPIGNYSRPTVMYRNQNAPLFVLTYAETELLLAEAATRGFNVSGSAAQHYSNALVAGMQSLARYGGNTISSATATAYAAAHPLVASTALQQINTEYWATTGLMMNFTAAWNNWKLSGYPALTPVNYTGNFSNGQIPRRQPYPTSESTLNSNSYRTAIGNLSGGDTWSSRVWWDK